jgi:ribosomal-protein-alanine N-acetyltransferase
MPQIETARLHLRMFTIDDLDDYYAAIRSDPDVMRYLPGRQAQSRERTEQVIRFFIDYWQDHPFGAFAVMHRVDNRLIGQVGLQYIPGQSEVELFYAYAKPYWGQGIAFEAGRACLRYGFETIGLERIYAMFIPGNIGSERVMMKLGMTSQGMRAAYDTELPSYAIAREAFDPGDAPYRLIPDSPALPA